MRRERDPYAGFEPFALRVFVPAVMSAGLLFSLLTLVRDAFAGRQHRGARRRATLAAANVVAGVLGEAPPPTERGLRPRRFYLVVGLGLGAASVYLAPGAFLNYAHDGGYVSDIAWLLSTSMLVAVLAAAASAMALATWWHWPHPPAVVRRTIPATPLAAPPASSGTGAATGGDPALGVLAFVSGAAFAGLAIGVGAARTGFAHFDRSVLDAVSGWHIPGWLDSVAALGDTSVALPLAALVGAAAWRCRPLAIAWAVAVASSFGIDLLVKAAIERPRPATAAVTGIEDSFPSGHVVQTTLLAVVVPLAIGQLIGRRWPGRAAGVVLGAAAVGTALERVHQGSHWPTDVVGGVLLGLTAGLSVRWATTHVGWHDRCRGCEASRAHPRPAPTPRSGIIALSPRAARRLRNVGGAALAVTVGVLLLVARGRGLPVDPEGEGMLASVEAPAQLVLLALAAVGGALERRLPAVGLTVVVAAALGLGLVASVEHPPLVSLGVTAAIGLPAVLLWLAWQRTQSPRRISMLGAVVAVLLTGQAVAAARIHDHFFGPAHPESATPLLERDLVEWAWAGDLRPDGATVVARLVDPTGVERASLLVTGPDGSTRRVATAVADDDGIVRLRAAGLTGATTYAWSIGVGDRVDTARGRGELTTAPDGAGSFTIAAGACARTGSDGAVYDAIRAADPLLYLITGDLHYRNLEATTPGPFLAAYGQALTSPSQSALYRQVPVDYVWDDHDYGPNDADSTSPGREAAQAAYRQAAPHPALPSDGAIFHASTVGRVRIVVTDTRSARTGGSMLGTEQLDWLLGELAAAADAGLVLWVNPDPWIAPDDPARDDWGGFADERRVIADAIAEHEVDNLVMVSGDAHMVALDDGSNSDYSTSGGGGFPVLHAGALDRPGNVKGGPYSDGAYPGAGQFGLIHVTDDGATVTVELTGMDWTGEPLVSRTFRFG